MTPPVIFDAGLQPERTLLAWRRTLLSLAVAGLVGLRMLPERLGSASALLSLAVLGSALLLQLFAERRSRRTYAELLAGRSVPPAGGLLLAVAALVALCGFGAAWWVIASGTRVAT